MKGVDFSRLKGDMLEIDNFDVFIERFIGRDSGIR
jgi:hypothetical protein